MPKIQWLDLPLQLREHLFDRAKDHSRGSFCAGRMAQALVSRRTVKKSSRCPHQVISSTSTM